MTTRKTEVPAFRYPGSKNKLARVILKYVPKRGRKFVDACAGRGNITFRAIADGLDYERWIVNDIARAPFFRAVRDRGDKFKTTQKSKAEFDRLAEMVKRGDPHALLMEPFIAFNGGTYDGGGSTTEGGRRSPASYEANVRLACELLRKKEVQITDFDWLTCLEAEHLGQDDFVMLDVPYIGCDVGAYSAESICPTELIEHLKAAKFNWVLTEYRQPLYIKAFGEPVYQKEVQLQTTNFAVTGGKERRLECLWTNIEKSVVKRDSVTVPCEPVPDDRADAYYVDLPEQELLREIRECATVITAARNQMNKEMRRRLLPALLELKRRTFRKHPSYYETLANMGLNPDTVRQWFYRSHTADEVIGQIEEEQEAPKETVHGGERPLDAKALLLQRADKIAKAILENKIKYAKRLATEYMQAREECWG